MAADRLIAVHIDDNTLGASGPDAEHERRVAIFDLIEENSFAITGQDRGPYVLWLSQAERRLILAVRTEGTTVAGVFTRSKCPSAAVDWCREVAADCPEAAAPPQQRQQAELGGDSHRHAAREAHADAAPPEHAAGVRRPPHPPGAAAPLAGTQREKR